LIDERLPPPHATSPKISLLRADVAFCWKRDTYSSGLKNGLDDTTMSPPRVTRK
jgi:hypothetical protein